MTDAIKLLEEAKVGVGGRKPVVTDEVLDKLRTAFLFGATDEEAAFFAQIGVATLYNYQGDHPEFLESKNEWKKNPIIKAKITVFNSLNDKETAKWYLERKLKDEFGARQEITGPSGSDLIPRLIEKLDKTDYERVAKEAERQMVALNPPIQDQGQGGKSDSVQTELPPAQTPNGEAQSQAQSDPQS